jgi:hypothetical protein
MEELDGKDVKGEAERIFLQGMHSEDMKSDKWVQGTNCFNCGRAECGKAVRKRVLSSVKNKRRKALKVCLTCYQVTAHLYYFNFFILCVFL